MHFLSRHLQNNPTDHTKISGQQKGYLVSTLKEYRSQVRNAGNYALVMQAASANLKDDDIEALANYMHGLYRK